MLLAEERKPLDDGACTESDDANDANEYLIDIRNATLAWPSCSIEKTNSEELPTTSQEKLKGDPVSNISYTISVLVK